MIEDIERAVIVLSVFAGVVAVLSVMLILALAFTASLLTIW